MLFLDDTNFSAGIAKDRCASDTQVLIRELINTILQRTFFTLVTLLVPLPLYFPVWIRGVYPGQVVQALVYPLCSRFLVNYLDVTSLHLTRLAWRPHFETSTGRKTKESGTETETSGSVSSNSRGISTQLKSNRKIGVEPTVIVIYRFVVAEIFVFLNYSKIVLLRQENIRIMLAVLHFGKKGKSYAQFLRLCQKLC